MAEAGLRLQKGGCMDTKKEVRDMAVNLLTKVVNGEVTDIERDIWSDSGHIILHWLREQLQYKSFRRR